MCGRYALVSSSELVKQHFGLSEGISLVPRYNIAPGQMIPLVAGAPRKIMFSQWGFIAHWAAKHAMPEGFINARVETVVEKPYFREAFKCRRGLVMASGYYEWRLGEKRRKQPYFISVEGSELLGLAAIWDRVVTQEGQTLETVAILTQEALPALAAIHARMPVVIAPADYSAWLNPKTPLSTVLSIASQASTMSWVAYAVTTQVNDPKHGSSGCLYKLSDQSVFLA